MTIVRMAFNAAGAHAVLQSKDINVHECEASQHKSQATTFDQIGTKSIT